MTLTSGTPPHVPATTTPKWQDAGGGRVVDARRLAAARRGVIERRGRAPQARRGGKRVSGPQRSSRERRSRGGGGRARATCVGASMRPRRGFVGASQPGGRGSAPARRLGAWRGNRAPRWRAENGRRISERIGSPRLRMRRAVAYSSANHTANRVFEDALRTTQIWRCIRGGYGCSEHGSRVVRKLSVIWYSVATDGTNPQNALQPVHLAGHLAKRVADLSLHQYDLSFCERILTTYGSKFVDEYDDLTLALWIAVLTKFISCFQGWGSDARRSLDGHKVYRSDAKAFEHFKFVMALRNKHIVHDVNSHYGANAFAWLEQDGDVRQVGTMIIVARIDPTLVAAMRDLVERAQEHVHVAIGDAGEKLLAEVQAMTPEARAALPKSIYFPLPTDDDIYRNRLVSKGTALGRGDEAIAVYDDLIARFGTATELSLREPVANALFKKGDRLGALGRGDEAIAVYDDLIARFGTATELSLREPVANALFKKGITLGTLGRGGEAIAVYDDLIARFGTATELSLREQVANALVNKGFGLGALGRGDEAIAVYDDLIARFGTATELSLREQVAKALVNKGATLDRGDEAIAVYDDVIARFGTATELSLREPVAKALVYKGITLGALGRGDEAIAVYDDLIARFGTATELSLREPVANALVNKGHARHARPRRRGDCGLRRCDRPLRHSDRVVAARTGRQSALQQGGHSARSAAATRRLRSTTM